MDKKISEWVWIFVLAIIVVIIVIYSINKKKDRLSHPTYVKGTSLGIKTGVRGQLHLHYRFGAYGKEYGGSVPSDFCNECNNCCNEGDTVIVRYERGKPENNDLVVKLPAGESFEDD